MKIDHHPHNNIYVSSSFRLRTFRKDKTKKQQPLFSVLLNGSFAVSVYISRQDACLVLRKTRKETQNK